MPTRLLQVLLTILACLAAGCDTGAGAEPSTGSDDQSIITDAATQPGWHGLPGPAALREAAYTGADLFQAGGDFLAGAAHYASVPAETTLCRLAPVGDDHDPAFAAYCFHLADYASAGRFTLDFEAAGDYGDLWLGLSDWDAGAWHWYDLAGPVSPAEDAASFSRFIDPETDLLYAVAAVTGATAWDLASISLAPLGPDYLNSGARLGMNLSGVPDWGRGWVFVDVFKHCRDWISQPRDGSTWDDGRTVSVDADGWVTRLAADQYAGNVLLTSQFGNYPSGEYVCLYDGTGSLNFRINASIVSEEPGRIVVAVDASDDGLVHVQITATDPADPVRNIRLVMPGYEATYETQLFHPGYLASIAPFRVLRFMDWQHTNGATLAQWADRPTPRSHSQTADGGVCVEYMVELCNRQSADPWFCMPHLADDDFVRQFAQYVSNNLDPGLRVYLEHSNEVWNGGFEQAGYARERGLALGLSTDAYQAQLFYHSRRSVEIFAIWEEVFGGTDRLVRVLSAQHANPWTGEQVMDFEDAWRHADMLGTAPYFGYELGTVAEAEHTKAMNIAEVIAACDVLSQEEALVSAENYGNAAARGLGLVAYEGGQHLVGIGAAQNDDDLTAHFQAVNRDAGMRQLYLDDLNRWDAAGGGLMCTFSHIGSYSKYGSWGVLEFQHQDTATAPKYLGLLDYLAQFE